MMTLATYNIKGGVGKTATAVNLAFLAARQGGRTLVWDLDPQGAATFYFRIKPKVKGGSSRLIRRRKGLDSLIRGTDFDLLDLLPADFSLRNLDLRLDATKKPVRRLSHLIKPLRREYDYLFLDCPPSISLASESVFEAADALLVPTIPTTLSLRMVKKLGAHLKRSRRRRPELFPFMCMVDSRRALHRDLCRQAEEDSLFLRCRIPYSSRVEQMGPHRAPLATFAARSVAARAFAALWQEIEDRLQDGGRGGTS
jgi:cellulose biosynthesis protein BcsQ